MNFGIDKISFYTSNYYVDLKDLAIARKIDPIKFQEDLGQYKMAVTPPSEDIVTLGANATSILLANENINDIEMVLFATETGIDQSKSAAAYIHQMFDLSKRCRVIELKQACYSATFALQMAIAYLHLHPEKKILLIASDIAKYEFGSNAESSQGCGAVAMLLSANPKLIEIENYAGFCTKEVMDFWRPNYLETALVDGRLSCDTYMRFAEETWNQYTLLSNRTFTDFDRFCYHMPVAKLVERTHKRLAKINGIKNLTEEQLNHQIGKSLMYNREVGNCYTASLYLSLISLLENEASDLSEKLIGFYSYGSGSSGEFFSGRIISGYRNHLFKNYHQQMLINRKKISIDIYEEFRNFKIPTNGETLEVTQLETGKFQLRGFNNHQRIYCSPITNC